MTIHFAIETLDKQAVLCITTENVKYFSQAEDLAVCIFSSIYHICKSFDYAISLLIIYPNDILEKNKKKNVQCIMGNE